MVVGSTCSLVWERRTTCWVTMRVPDPNIPLVRRPLPVREGRDLDHHVTACSEGAGVRGHAGGGGLCWACFRPHFCWGGGGSKRPAPLFPGPQGGPAHGLHPRFVVAEIWANKGVVGGRPRGGWPATVVRGAWCQALSLSRPPVLWSGQPGFRVPCVPGAVGVGVGTQHRPHSVRPCGLALLAVGVAEGRPRGRCFPLL